MLGWEGVGILQEMMQGEGFDTFRYRNGAARRSLSKGPWLLVFFLTYNANLIIFSLFFFWVSWLPSELMAASMHTAYRFYFPFPPTYDFFPSSLLSHNTVRVMQVIVSSSPLPRSKGRHLGQWRFQYFYAGRCSGKGETGGACLKTLPA